MNRSAIACLILASCVFPFAFGCSSGDDVTCGPGTTLDGGTCYVKEGADRDAEGDATSKGDAPTDAKTDGKTASDGASEAAAGLTFGGVTSVAPASLTALQITWDPAKDANAPGSSFTYKVYIATAAGKENFDVPQSTTAPGATSLVIDTLQANKKYFVVVRAVDEDKVEDTNTIEQSATTELDTKPPKFAGATKAASSPEGSLVLSWIPATDNLTPKPGIAYLVYLATAAGEEDLFTPDYVSDLGATSITISGLADPGSTYYAVVRASDAAGNVDTNSKEVSQKAGADTVPPAFAGCTAAIAKDASSVTVAWNAATDDTTPVAQIAYDVFVSTTPGGEDFTSPAATFTGVTTGLVTGLSQGTTYYFVCRARDTSGNEDTNKSERIATTLTDTTPPVFAGLASITNSTAMSVDLQWLPATDNQTPQASIVYLIYEASAAGAEDFAAAPVMSTAAGATSATITNLASSSTFYFVVRARDEAGNIDKNIAELSATTGVSFLMGSESVVSVFAQHCAVAGCHVPGNPPEGQVLTSDAAYSNLVNVSTGECPEPPATLPAYCPQPYFRIVPSDTADSYLYLKVVGTAPFGTQMPPPSTGDSLSATEIAIITNWITEGALNN